MVRLVIHLFRLDSSTLLSLPRVSPASAPFNAMVVRIAIATAFTMAIAVVTLTPIATVGGFATPVFGLSKPPRSGSRSDGESAAWFSG